MDRRLLFFVISLSLALLAVRFGFDTYYGDERKQWAETHPQHAPVQEAETPAPEPEHFAAHEVPAPELGATPTYYVLQNAYQQLVFSSIGGALVEINLPFTSKRDSFSDVLPIAVDRELKEQSPKNCRFPLFPSTDAQKATVAPTVGGYYPLLRRDLLSDTGAIATAVPPADYGLNVVSEYPELARLAYRVTHFSSREITFEALQPQRRITKRFYFPENPDAAPYCFALDITIEGDRRGLWLTSGVPEVEWQSGSLASSIKYRLNHGGKPVVEKLELPKESFTLSSVSPDWVCNSNGFFGIILDPIQGQGEGFRAERVPGAQDISRLTLLDHAYNRFPADDLPGYNTLFPLKPSAKTMQFRVFAGPFAESILHKVDAFYAEQSGGTPSDYLECQTFHGWFAFISEPFAKFLYFLMKIFYQWFGSWALSIVLVTVVLRVLLYPLNSWSLRSMKAMQEIAPDVKAIQERHKKDPKKAQLEIMTLYRERSVNPFSGCLPLLLQMPFLIGMFDLLKSTYELRGASFIPGWINNLAAPDVLFSWSYPLPLVGNEFHLLPILLGGVMYVQQTTMSRLPKDKTLWTEQQRQSQSMGLIMTVVMTVLFYQFPSGLNLYWISSMLLGIVQQWWTNRKPTLTSQTIPIVVKKTGRHKAK